MRRTVTAVMFGATALGLSAVPSLALDFPTPVSACIVDTPDECFEILFAEFTKRARLLEHPHESTSYLGISAAILVQAEMPERAEAAARQIENPAHLDELLGHIGAAYAQKGLTDDALRILDDVEEHYSRVTLIVAIASALAMDGDFEEAVAPLVPLMPPESFDTVFTEISFSLAEAGQLAKASEAAQFISDPLFQGNALSQIALRRAKAGEIAQAVANLERIRNLEFNVLAWGEAGYALHQDGFLSDAKDFYDRAVTMVEESRSEDVDHDMQLEVITGYLVRSGYIDEAAPLIEQIQKPAPRAFLYNRIGDHFIQTGDNEQATIYLRRAIAIAANKIKAPHHYNTVVHHSVSSLAKAGGFDVALSTARDIDDANIRGAAIKAVGDVFWKQGDVARAEEIYRLIDHFDQLATALIEMSRALETEGSRDVAVATLEGLERDLAQNPPLEGDAHDATYLRGSTISSLSRAYADSGDLSAGLRVAMTLTDHDQRLWTLIPIFEAALLAREDGFAEELHETLLDEFRSHPNPGNLGSLAGYLATLPPNLENIDRHQVYAAILEDDMSKSLFYNAVFETLTATENYGLADQVHALIPEKSIRDLAAIELLKRRIQRITNIN